MKTLIATLFAMALSLSAYAYDNSYGQIEDTGENSHTAKVLGIITTAVIFYLGTRKK